MRKICVDRQNPLCSESDVSLAGPGLAAAEPVSSFDSFDRDPIVSVHFHFPASACPVNQDLWVIGVMIMVLARSKNPYAPFGRMRAEASKGGGGGKSTGGNWPSPTGKPSGAGRGNKPPSK